MMMNEMAPIATVVLGGVTGRHRTFDQRISWARVMTKNTQHENGSLHGSEIARRQHERPEAGIFCDLESMPELAFLYLYPYTHSPLLNVVQQPA